MLQACMLHLNVQACCDAFGHAQTQMHALRHYRRAVLKVTAQQPFMIRCEFAVQGGALNVINLVQNSLVKVPPFACPHLYQPP